jgi:hypothetical protein
MRPIVYATLLTTTLLWCRPATADIITIEPDNFAAGANLTAATDGVLLWTARVTGLATDPLLLSAVYAQHSAACADGDLSTQCFAATGTQAFSPFSAPEGTLLGWSSDRHPAACFGQLNNPEFPGPNACVSFVGFTALLIELSLPTSFVEIAGAWNADFLELRALDADFNLLSLPQTLTIDPRLPGYANTGTVVMTSASANMRYVFAGSTEGGIALDRLSFEQQVPEPSTLLLTIAGFAGLYRHLRRRTRST